MSRKLETIFRGNGGVALVRTAGITLCLALPACSHDVEAKAPGVSHCYRNVCHKVRTIEQTRRLIGQPFTVETSYYDIPGVDRFNTGVFTSNGERFDADDSGRVASADLPDGTELLLRNPINGRVSHVRVNDFGPFRGNRRLDVTRRVAEDLDFRHKGVVRLEVIVIAAPQDEDLKYRRNRPRRPTAGHLGVIFEAEMPALVSRLADGSRGGEQQVAQATGSEFVPLSAFASTEVATASEPALALDLSPPDVATSLEPAAIGATIAMAQDLDAQSFTGLQDAPRLVLEPAVAISASETDPAPAPEQRRTTAAVTTSPDDMQGTTMSAPARVLQTIAVAADEPSYLPTMATAVGFAPAAAKPSSHKPSMPLLLLASAISALLAVGLAVRQRPARADAGPQPPPPPAANRSRTAARLSDDRFTAASGTDERTPAAAAAAPAAARATSHLAAELEIHGALTCPGRLEVAGRIKGRVEADEVIVLPGGRIEGEVITRVLDIAGSAQGTLVCDSLTVHRQGEVEGRVVTRLISIELDSRFEAEITHASRA